MKHISIEKSSLLPIRNPYFCQIEQLAEDNFCIQLIDRRTGKWRWSTGASTFDRAVEVSAEMIKWYWDCELEKMAREN